MRFESGPIQLTRWRFLRALTRKAISRGCARGAALLVALALALLVGPPAPRADEIKIQPVRFARGASSATMKGTIKGYQVVDYTLRARAGQEMTVKLATRNPSNYFNVLPPGSEVALFVGSTSGNEFRGPLPQDGEYRVRVYLMRNAARRNETASFTLTVGIAGQGDAKVAGSPYHATGTIPCSVGSDPKGSAQCSFGVIRTGRGQAEVRIASPGFDVVREPRDLRVLRFSGDSVTSPDPAATVRGERQGDNWLVDVNGFHFYTIPEAVISGG